MQTVSTLSKMSSWLLPYKVGILNIYIYRELLLLVMYLRDIYMTISFHVDAYVPFRSALIDSSDVDLSDAGTLYRPP